MSIAPTHHEVFAKFDRWMGPTEPGFEYNWLGVRTRHSFYLGQEQLRELRPPPEIVQPSLPSLSEEYFEWIDVLEAVLAAQDRFTMVELGAGYGRWLSVGAAAAMARGIDYSLVGVEAEPSHFRWMQEHLKTNGLAADRCDLVEAAVAASEGSVEFWVGDPVTWYGQAIAAPLVQDTRVSIGQRLAQLRRARRDALKPRRHRVRSVTLGHLLAKIELVDLIDLDVQGVEAEVLSSAPEILDSKVRRVHIGTHSLENEEALRTLFNGLEWTNVNDYPCAATSKTPWGEIAFQDGVQTWINPRLSTSAPSSAERHPGG